MTTPTAPDSPHDHTDLRLHAALRAYARGLYAVEAGVELLIDHATFLRRDDFITRFMHLGTNIVDDTDLAMIDWSAAITALDADEFPCSGGESRILRLAASLADGQPVSLRDAVTGIDDRGINLVTRAVQHASGQRPHDKTP
jgi:hypothetical protein